MTKLCVGTLLMVKEHVQKSLFLALNYVYTVDLVIIQCPMVNSECQGFSHTEKLCLSECIGNVLKSKAKKALT